MKRAIHGHGKAHLQITVSLSNLALVCNCQGKLIQRIQFHGASLVIQRVSHDPNAISLTNFPHACQEFDQLQNAVVIDEQRPNMKRTVRPKIWYK